MGRTLSNPKNTPDMAATSAAVAPARLTSSCIACTAIVGGPGSADITANACKGNPVRASGFSTGWHELCWVSATMRRVLWPMSVWVWHEVRFVVWLAQPFVVRE